MTKFTASHVGKLVILPVLVLVLLAAIYAGQMHQFGRWVPHWQTLMILATSIILEQIFKRVQRVSQKAMIVRDVLSSIVNVYATGIVAGAIFYLFLVYLPQHFLGRKMILASSSQLGPLWLQVATIVLVMSFVRYWIHRLQHIVPFLWRFHSYHHRATDLQISNKYVSHPIDFALRNVLIYSILFVVGFNNWAFFIAAPILEVAGAFDHCGADLGSPPLNYLLVTPQVHRWHHAERIPDGYGYSCNYGVEFSFWDIVFGTYYLPYKNGVAECPERIGYPGGGLPDESNYSRLLLAPLGFYKAANFVKRSRPSTESSHIRE